MKHRKSEESGVSMLESLMAIIIMCLIFFGMMQVFHWAVAKMFCDYSAFYASKAHSLGYAKRTIDKAARVAAIGISGEDQSSPRMNIRYQGRSAMQDMILLYMATGDAGLHFSYWDPARSNEPDLRLRLSGSSMGNNAEMLTSSVTLRNAPMLHESWSRFFQLRTDHADPEGMARMYNHSRNYLE